MIAAPARVRPKPADPGIAQKYVVLDLETNADRADITEHEIFEIGACRVVNGTVADTSEALARPARPLLHELVDLTGISEAELAAAGPIDRALMGLHAFVGDLPVVAHNGFAYDFAALDAALARLGYEPSPKDSTTTGA